MLLHLKGDIEDEAKSDPILSDLAVTHLTRLRKHLDASDAAESPVSALDHRPSGILEALVGRTNQLADLADPHGVRTTSDAAIAPGASETYPPGRRLPTREEGPSEDSAPVQHSQQWNPVPC